MSDNKTLPVASNGAGPTTRFFLIQNIYSDDSPEHQAISCFSIILDQVNQLNTKSDDHDKGTGDRDQDVRSVGGNLTPETPAVTSSVEN